MESHIKNIIFDLGGVLLDIDYQRSIDAFKTLGFSNIEETFNKEYLSGFFEEMEKGSISPEDFRHKIRQILNKTLDDNTIDRAWNAILIGFKPERIELLKQLKHKYRTFLLSNTNIIHYYHYNQLLFKHTGVRNISILFEKDYYSHEIGVRKPDETAYKIILDNHKLNPAETLFIDDAAINLEGAAKLGINTIQVSESFTIMDIDW